MLFTDSSEQKIDKFSLESEEEKKVNKATSPADYEKISLLFRKAAEFEKDPFFKVQLNVTFNETPSKTGSLPNNSSQGQRKLNGEHPN